MTLLRQLVILIATLFVLLFAGSVAINVKNTRDYLDSQLQTISQDMATSLALSLSPHMASGEMVMAERLVDAVSDSGYYREVVITDVEGKVLVERRQEVRIEGVPAWFVAAIPLNTPTGEAGIMAGWSQAGNLRLSANPGYAYVTLWRNSVEALLWFLGASLTVLVLGIVALRFVLRPLQEVEAQARAICDREYPVQQRLPWTLELRSVVEAMNRMTSKVKEMFDEQSEALQRLRDEAWKDALTGLANRRYFDMQITHLTATPEAFGQGALYFIELHEFKEYNERTGFASGDKRLREIAAMIEAACKHYPDFDGFAARLNGPSFAIVAANRSENELTELAAVLATGLEKIGSKNLLESGNVGHIGYSLYAGQGKGTLLSEADMALRIAQNAGPNAQHHHSSQGGGKFASLSGGAWSAMLNRALESHHCLLLSQPTLSASQQDEPPRALHHEVLLRVLSEEQEIIPATMLIPMARRFHLSQRFDQMVVSEVVRRLTTTDFHNVLGDSPIAINLFPQSIGDTAFTSGLVELLSAHRHVAQRLMFELHEHGASSYPAALDGFITQVHSLGAKIGLDQFGRGFSSVDYLSAMKIDYVRIDGSFTRGIDGHPENQFFVDSLVKVAHGLDIAVYAESVETDQEAAMLRSLRVDGLKGYGLVKPSEWTTV